MNNPVYSSALWRSQVPTLLTIAAEGSFFQRRLAVTLLARELAGRWWSSVWNVASNYFALEDLRIGPEHGPEMILRAQYLGGGGAKRASYYANYGREGGVLFPTGYGQRITTVRLPDGTNHNFATPVGPPGQIEITNDCTTRAAALIEGWSP